MSQRHSLGFEYCCFFSLMYFMGHKKYLRQILIPLKQGTLPIQSWCSQSLCLISSLLAPSLFWCEEQVRCSAEDI